MAKKNSELALVDLLRTNARLSFAELGDMLGHTESEIETLVHKLEKNGTILQYTTLINEAILPSAKEKIRALIEVSIRPEKKTGFDAIAKRICKHPNVVDHYLISGSYDFLIIVEGSSLQEISSFVSDKLASIENVRSIGTHFILKKYKENGVILDIEEKESRIAIVP